MIVIMAIAILTILFFLIFIVLRNALKPIPNNDSKGKEGENAVKRTLERLSISPKHLFHDYYFIPHDDVSIQIDHIVVCKKGVIVIETKNISGELFGSESEEKWRQILAGGRITHEHYNPVMQNQTHIRMLSRAIGRNVPFINLVVLVQNNTEHIVSFAVIGISTLLSRINKLPDIMGEATVEEIAHILKTKNAKGKVSHRSHVRNVRKRHG